MARIVRIVRASLVALVVALVGVAAPVAPAPVGAQGIGVTDAASALVVAYFDAINAGDYRTAYGYLGNEVRSYQSYAQFVALFDTLDYEELNVDRVEYRGANTIVSVRLSRYNRDGSAIYYTGTYTVRENGPRLSDNQIIAIALTQTGSQPPSGASAAARPGPGVTDSAGAFIVYYFDAINAGDYRRAYACYSPQLQRNQSYAQFAGLFTNLAYEELSVDGVAYRGADSIVSVRLSRFNTDGTAIYYTGTYTVRENGPRLADMQITAINLTRQ